MRPSLDTTGLVLFVLSTSLPSLDATDPLTGVLVGHLTLSPVFSVAAYILSLGIPVGKYEMMHVD